MSEQERHQARVQAQLDQELAEVAAAGYSPVSGADVERTTEAVKRAVYDEPCPRCGCWRNAYGDCWAGCDDGEGNRDG